MSIQSDLKKDGITVIKRLDTLTINTIAKNISHKLVLTFPEMNFNETSLFVKLSRIDMYMAEMPCGLAEANYFYKNSSIYFNSGINTEDLEEFAIHECIHYLQEVKNGNKLLKMGLCTFNNLKPTGLGINEAAVQLITSKIIGITPEFVKYYGIEFKTSSPSYYPVECNLLEQLMYLFGEDVVFKSTFNSTSEFKEKFISLIPKRTFDAIINAIDLILEYEESIIKLNNSLVKIEEHNNKSISINEKISSLKQKISTIFMRTQNLILSSYFNSEFNKITNLEELDNYRKKLEGYKNFIGKMDGYFFFDNFYTEKMCALEHKSNIFENGEFETALATKKINKFIILLSSIKNLFYKKKLEN